MPDPRDPTFFPSAFLAQVHDLFGKQAGGTRADLPLTTRADAHERGLADERHRGMERLERAEAWEAEAKARCLEERERRTRQLLSDERAAVEARSDLAHIGRGAVVAGTLLGVATTAAALTDQKRWSLGARLAYGASAVVVAATAVRAHAQRGLRSHACCGVGTMRRQPGLEAA